MPSVAVSLLSIDSGCLVARLHSVLVVVISTETGRDLTSRTDHYCDHQLGSAYFFRRPQASKCARVASSLTSIGHPRSAPQAFFARTHSSPLTFPPSPRPLSPSLHPSFRSPPSSSHASVVSCSAHSRAAASSLLLPFHHPSSYSSPHPSYRPVCSSLLLPIARPPSPPSLSLVASSFFALELLPPPTQFILTFVEWAVTLCLPAHFFTSFSNTVETACDLRSKLARFIIPLLLLRLSCFSLYRLGGRQSFSFSWIGYGRLYRV